MDLTVYLNTLNSISNIKVGDKFNTYYLTTIDGSTWYSSFYRKMYQESRDHLIIFLKNIVVESRDYIRKYEYNEDISIIVNTLYKARNGMINLLITYKNDKDMILKLEECIDDINFELSSKYYLLYDNVESSQQITGIYTPSH